MPGKTPASTTPSSAQGVEAPDPAHEHHGGGSQPPGDHDAADPAPCPDPCEHEVARDLKEAVPEEEDAGADVEREHERDETAGHAAQRRGLELRAGITHRGAAPRGDGSR